LVSTGLGSKVTVMVVLRVNGSDRDAEDRQRRSIRARWTPR
jgi:hypothetical protein